jgi:hypothetical protein
MSKIAEELDISANTLKKKDEQSHTSRLFLF